MVFRFDAELWRYPGDGNTWHFVTLPTHVSEEIRASTDGMRRGFGSVRVSATIGASTWLTSVFPESRTGCFVLPVKKPVRRAEDIEDGDRVSVLVRLETEVT